MTSTPPTLTSEPEESTDSQDLAATGQPELVSSFGEYLRGWVKRVKAGESGVLPVVAGLIVIIIIFRYESPVFLTAGNITNLLVQGAAFVLLGMAEVFVLLLGEIDLSIGYVGAVGAVFTVWISGTDHGWPWWAAIVLGLVVTSAIGAAQGLLITRLRLPSFVVTLAGLLGWQGVLIYLCNHFGGKTGGGTLSIENSIINDIVNGNMGTTTGWIVMAVAVVVLAASMLLGDRHRRTSGMATPPFGLVVAKIVVIVGAGVVLVAICNANRGLGLTTLQGVPWVVPIVLVIVAGWTFLLDRTRFGRYMYAIGGNAEAARRAGIRVNGIRLAAFSLAGLTAGAAGIVYASRLGSISSNVDGGQLVLFAVAAAVIGGTSLFGGRGKMVHALLGGLVIATVYNGMGLVGLTADTQLMVTGLVLLGAATVDALARRGQAT